LFVVAARTVKRANLTPFVLPTWPFGQFGWSGVLHWSRVMFFAYIGLMRCRRRRRSPQPVA
jgi:hypothetical protein